MNERLTLLVRGSVTVELRPNLLSTYLLLEMFPSASENFVVLANYTSQH